MLLARFVHVGAAVDLLLKDAETAREFAAVDVMALLMADLPDEFTRERVDGLVKLLVPHYINRSVSGPNFVALSQALPELKEQDRATFDRVAFSLVTAVNCRVGLERLVRRLTPGDEPEAEPRAQSADPVVRQCGRLMDLAGSGTPVWDGDLSTPSARLDGNVVGLEFRPNHANTAAYTGALSRSRPSPHQMPAAYATYPFVSGEPGRWRVVRCELPEDTERGTVSPGTAFRTATSVALVVGVDYQVPLERVLLEYAPEGEFAEEGPLATAGAGLLDACVLEPVRSADWFARFSELWRERDRPPVSPELAAVFAEKTGLSEAEAAVVLQGALLSAPYQLAPDDPVRLVHPGSRPSRWTRWSPEMDRARESLRALRPPEFYTRLYERLLPDDPEELWSSGPAVDRAAAWCSQESGAPFPLPSGLLPRALKEITQPRGEAPLPRAPRASPWVWRSGRPSLRPWVLIGRVAAGGDCLADASAFSGEPDPLALPRVAAWLAYRTPAGDPLRPAIGAGLGAAPGTLGAAPGGGMRGDPPAGRGRGGPLPDASRPARPVRPQREGVDRLEARPVQGGGGRTRRLGARAERHPGACGALAVRARRVAGVQGAAPAHRGAEDPPAAAGGGAPLHGEHGRRPVRPRPRPLRPRLEERASPRTAVDPPARVVGRVSRPSRGRVPRR
jgi:hypothetical protein